MTKLVTAPNLALPDDFYADLIAAHDGKSDLESEAYNARLILVLANHIGDHDILREALETAQ
jgi:hypothetical protein